MRHFLVRGLRRLGHAVEAAADGEAALAWLSRQRFDVTVLDVRMPGLDGLAVLARARALDPGCTVVLMTAHGSVATAVDAMKLGAADFVQKPFDLEELCLRLSRALELRDTRRENRDLRQLLQRGTVPGLVAQSAAMRALLLELELLRGSDATVLLTGESGTGKGLLARALHAQSARSAGPFVVVNCPAIPETLFESTLFGHVAGAFTGAATTRLGQVARAAGGTLFLDEIGELSLAAQAKLERFLQEREFTPVGAAQQERVDVRIVAATNRDLALAVQQGTFRAELLWRLKVVHLQVPPLRQRREDVPLLAIERLRELGARAGTPAKTMTAEALAAMAAYDWPGNVRELENLTERMAVLAGDRVVLGTGDLPAELRGLLPVGDDDGDYEAARRRFDRAYFTALLVRCGGSITEAARSSGISRGHLHRRLRELRIEAGGARQLDVPSQDDAADDTP
jgi:two-component system response regulator HydG